MDTISLILVIDLVTKIIFADVFQDRYNEGNFDNIVVLKYVLSFTYTENVGAAFSMFSGKVALLIIFSVAFIVMFVYLDISFRDKSKWLLAGFTLIIGGAIGNLIDRIFLGYVRDFISFDFLKNFAICNIADVCITVGCICYAIYLILYIVKTSKSKTTSTEDK